MQIALLKVIIIPKPDGRQCSVEMWILELRGLLIDFGQLSWKGGLGYPTGAFLGLEMNQSLTFHFLLKGGRRRDWPRGIGATEGTAGWEQTDDCYCQMQTLENGEENWSSQVGCYFHMQKHSSQRSDYPCIIDNAILTCVHVPQSFGVNNHKLKTILNISR